MTFFVFSFSSALCVHISNNCIPYSFNAVQHSYDVITICFLCCAAQLNKGIEQVERIINDMFDAFCGELRGGRRNAW